MNTKNVNPPKAKELNPENQGKELKLVFNNAIIADFANTFPEKYVYLENIALKHLYINSNQNTKS